MPVPRPLPRGPGKARAWRPTPKPRQALLRHAGYLRLAETLCRQGAAYAEGWNFGPDECDARPVNWMVETLCAQIPGATWQADTTAQPHEAGRLMLDSAKARDRLGWRPRWPLPLALARTLEWHSAWRQGDDMAAVSLGQIHAYATTPP